MSSSIHLVLVLHNHQPVGNFDGVIEQAFYDSYRPFLDVFEGYPNLRIGLHVSGPLLEWLDARQPDYVDRLAALVGEGRIEIVGGAFYEPILTMIPSRDRIGQIRDYSAWLKDRLSGEIQGMWPAERVWEQSLVRDIADAGIRYTLIDDFHFKAAGLAEEELFGYFLTEDDGRVISLFPGSERLRYTVPFAAPQETIDYLGRIAERRPGALVVFADDGEKFGSWPETHRHVYDQGWLRNFFDHLSRNQHWINVTTPSEALRTVAPSGKIYLPDASYREMTEWVLPADRQNDLLDARHDLEHDPRWPRIAPFVRGGYWRNYKVKYPEANEMYARMMMVSRRLEEVEVAGAGAGRPPQRATNERVDEARRELYRGQCNCAYWHGAFGGIYLPHLRNAVYHHLIAAENLLEEVSGRQGTWIEAVAGDWNFDARQEVRLANDQLVALVAPAAGGTVYELDVRAVCHNLLATLARRPEAYHRKVRSGAATGEGAAASIHDRVVFKQQGLEQRLGYDPYPRKCLVDHFFEVDASADSVARGDARELGDFVLGVYEARLRRNPDRIQVQMTRDGAAGGLPLRITKGVTLAAGSATMEIAYLIEGLPPDRVLHFAVELNFAGMPAGAEDRFFHDARGTRLGHLGARLNLSEATQLALRDEWLGLDVTLAANRPTEFWTYPVETVSQSEGGFELVHQSVAVLPHWLVQGDQYGRWSLRMNVSVDSGPTERRVIAPARVTVASPA
jgi:alpha-amylase